MTAALTALVALSAAWAVLLLGLGNVGLQQSLSHPWRIFFVDYPLVTLGAVLAAAVVSALGSVRANFGGRQMKILAATTIAALAAMSWIVAPILIGELEFQHGFMVLAVLSVLGFVPLAIVLGAGIALTVARRT